MLKNYLTSFSFIFFASVFFLFGRVLLLFSSFFIFVNKTCFVPNQSSTLSERCAA